MGQHKNEKSTEKVEIEGENETKIKVVQNVGGGKQKNKKTTNLQTYPKIQRSKHQQQCKRKALLSSTSGKDQKKTD